VGHGNWPRLHTVGLWMMWDVTKLMSATLYPTLPPWCYQRWTGSSICWKLHPAVCGLRATSFSLVGEKFGNNLQVATVADNHFKFAPFNTDDWHQRSTASVLDVVQSSAEHSNHQPLHRQIQRCYHHNCGVAVTMTSMHTQGHLYHELDIYVSDHDWFQFTITLLHTKTQKM